MGEFPPSDGFVFGRVAAVAVDCERDLRDAVTGYEGLFPDPPIGGSVLSGVALANAFGSPWCSAGELRVACRTSLWIFAVDLMVDTAATGPEEVAHVINASLDVADGGSPDPTDLFAVFLAGLRDLLIAAPAFPAFHRRWRGGLERMLRAMGREWGWKAARGEGDLSAPSLSEYLDNADNFGSSFVNISHWIATGDPETLECVDDLLAVSDRVQRVLRLLNDLATYRRDIEWGDLNALLLGASHAQVTQLVSDLIDECLRLLAPLGERCPAAAEYLRRQIGYSAGFYGAGADYWGLAPEAFS